MKKSVLKIFFFTIMFTLFVVNVNAASWYDDYTYSLENNKIILTSYNGSAENLTVKSSAKINNVTYKTIIQGGVYSNNTTLKTITFENGIKAGDSLYQLFYNCSNLKSVTFNDFDTSATTNMSRMFRGASSLTELDLSKFNTSNVTNMYQMFMGLSSLEKLNISNFDTSSVENMDDMYDGLSVSKFKTITIGKKMDFHIKDSIRGGLFGRGTWKKAGTNEEYSVIEIALNAALGKGAGTYNKTSNISQELPIRFTAAYKINNLGTVSSYNQTGNNFIKLTEEEAFVYKIPLEDIENKTYNDSLTLHYDDAVVDASGNKYDFEILIDNIKLHNLIAVDGVDYGYIYLYKSNKRSYSLYKYIYASLDDIYNGSTIPGTSSTDATYDVTLKILDKNGNPVEGSFIFSAADIDIGSFNDTNSQYLNIAGDLGYASHSEGVNFISGYNANTLSLASSYSFLINPSDKRITGTRCDNNSEATEFLVQADSTGFKYTWTVGKNAGTSFLNYYQPRSVLIENQNTLGELIVGNKLELYDANGNKVENWYTEDEGISLFLNPGKYVLHQTSVVDDYIIANDLEFFVDIENKLTYNGEEVEKIVIINDKIGDKYRITTEVVNGIISDSVTVDPNGEATITYKPEEGYILKEIYIDGELIEIGDNKDSYTFKNVLDNHTIKVVYEIENPKTGSMISFISIGIIGAISVISFYKYRKHNKLFKI